MSGERKLALAASPSEQAQEAAKALKQRYEWVSPKEADIMVALGGDGFLLQTLHQMLDRHRALPVFGMNLGTVGFLMNEWSPDLLENRLMAAKTIKVAPIRMDAITIEGEKVSLSAINEVSLLRETRQAAWIEVSVDDRVVLAELVADGVLVSTPAGSTAYNFSAHGPILPLESALVALTPISPFRPRRWRGAILRDQTRIRFRVLDPIKRPVSAVADNVEVRNVVRVEVVEDRSISLVMLFDAGRSLEERMLAEQFQA